jgi:hypothetical protein
MSHFKPFQVWVYNPREIGRNACCERKVSFSSLFPTVVDSPSAAEASPSLTAKTPPQPPPLTGSISTVFYSYHFRSMFFFHGEAVYENVAYEERTPAVNRLVYRGPWYNLWYDICDVD